MIAYLKGNLTYKTPTNIYLDVGGIAYDVNISLNTYEKIENLEQTKLYTQLIIRENEHSLYGFFELAEKQIFKQLLSVSGIGPNTARVILSYMNTEEVKSAILHDNVAAFKKVKGVGPKTAQRIILDLKDKIAKDSLELKNNIGNSPISIREEAISALVSLGFQKSQVSKLVDKTLSADNSIDQVEHLIKAVLKQL